MILMMVQNFMKLINLYQVLPSSKVRIGKAREYGTHITQNSCQPIPVKIFNNNVKTISYNVWS